MQGTREEQERGKWGLDHAAKARGGGKMGKSQEFLAGWRVRWGWREVRGSEGGGGGGRTKIKGGWPVRRRGVAKRMRSWGSGYSRSLMTQSGVEERSPARKK